jgi:hypothetical protein
MDGLQKARTNGYPRGSKNQVGFVVWAVAVLLNIQLIWNGQDKDYLWLPGFYGLFELAWEFFMVTPYWARRKVILINAFITRQYGSSQTVAD